MPAWVVVSGVVWTAVPALPVRATAWTRPSSVAMRRQVDPVRRSATRTSSSASQQIRTWARMRCWSRWKTGRSSRFDFRSRKPRSASRRFLWPSAASWALMCGSEVAIRYLPSSLASAFDLGPVDHEAPVGLLVQPAAECGVIAQRALGLRVRGRGVAFGGAALAVLSLGAGLRDPVQLGLQAGDGVLALGAVS